MRSPEKVVVGRASDVNSFLPEVRGSDSHDTPTQGCGEQTNKQIHVIS